MRNHYWKDVEIGLPGQTGRRKATVQVPPALADLAAARGIELILS